MRIASLVAAALAAWLSAAPAHAASFLSNALDPALSGDSVFTLDGEADNFRFTSYTVGGAFTLSTTGGDLRFDNQWTANFGTTGISLETRHQTGTNQFDITFTTPVAAFGFNVNALDINWQLEVFDATNASLGVFTIAAQSPGMTGNNRRGYAGASSTGTPIAWARVTTQNPADGADFALVDNFALASVPETQTAVLLTMGLIGLTAAGTPRRS